MGFKQQLQRSLPCDKRAPFMARRSLAPLEASVTSEVLYTTMLLVTELVTNSVRHSGTSSPNTISLIISTRGTTLRAAVTDAGTAEIRSATEPLEPARTGGRGLVIVSRLSDRWGVCRGEGNTVWFELQTA